MVCRRMGLLDDAIRDHLELKRRRGADPAEVAREQHEALDPPADPSRSTEPEARAEGDVGVVTDDHGVLSVALDQGLALDDRAMVEPAGDERTPSQPAHSSASPEEPGSLEETAELDMKAVLEDDEPSESDAAEVGWGANEAGSPEQSPNAGAPWHAREGEGDSPVGDLAHDTPDITGPLPGQEHLQFEHDPAADRPPKR
jgi:hypothetical protein